MTKLHKVIIVCQVEAASPYEAEDIMRGHVKPFRHLVERLFVSTKQQSKGWFSALLGQLFG